MFVRLATLRGAIMVNVGQSPLRLAQAVVAGESSTKDIGGLEGAARLDAIQFVNTSRVAAALISESRQLDCQRCGNRSSIRFDLEEPLFGSGAHPKGDMVSDDSSRVHSEELTMKGLIHHAPRYVATSVSSLSSGRFDGMSLISEIRPLEAFVESLEDMAAGRGAKSALVPSGIRN